MSITINKKIPRIPLDGTLDITYRCNNLCRHCWLWVPDRRDEVQSELTLDEIKHIVIEARSMGCQAWFISGGEPMLREDFVDIFDFITHNSLSYSLNTNGTLITPQIASLMRRKGKNMVALYGATAEIHDRVTRNPGSFDATMRGFSYLKEAGAGFIVQIIPMRENYHQFEQMKALAEELSPHYRIGALWLMMTSCHSVQRNQEIAQQRLNPVEVISLDPPKAQSGERRIKLTSDENDFGSPGRVLDDNLFTACINERNEFHIDPYGSLSFCYYIKDSALRYDLRKGSFQEGWEVFLPSLIGKVRGGKEYLENCALCDLKQDCHWCAVHGFLEHGRYSAKVDYLCQIAKETRQHKELWLTSHVRFFQLAGVTIELTTDFPITENTFSDVLKTFDTQVPGDDIVRIRLSSTVPSSSSLELENEIISKPPWAVFRRRDSYIYWCYIHREGLLEEPHFLAITDLEHNNISIFRDNDTFKSGNLHSLTTFPTDQTLLARMLASRKACYLHSAGIIVNGKGFLFIGHSEAGKSTMMKMLRGLGEILCDDRNVIRRWPDGFRIHGTWNHGDLSDVSPNSAKLAAIFYLEQAQVNEAIQILNKGERLGKVLSHVVKPLETADWWDRTLELAGIIASEVPAYTLRFDKSGDVVNLIKEFSTSS